MPKRISRKLLVGLGSIVTFGAVGTVSGFGIKSIIDSSLNNSKLNQLTVNSSQTGFITDIPNYHIAEKDMFIETKNLKRFHFGNAQIGQKITPWGWLGVFEDDGGIKSRIALTGWNGEIIWVNETYKTLEKFNVYDIQYDFNSNLIFVLRTNSNNGFYNGNDDYPEVLLEVLNAKTGEKYKDSVSDSRFEELQRKAKQKLINDSSLLQNYDTDDKIKAKTKNLYYLDLTYSDKKKAILATWMPNYMQMARQSYSGTQDGSLPSFFDVVKTWEDAATSFVFQTEKLKNQEVYSKKQRKFKLSKSSGIREVTDNQGKLTQVKIKEGPFENSSEVDGDTIFLLTNPFFTTSHNGEAFVMHLIGATVAGKVYHKTIGWTVEIGDQPTTDGVIYQLTTGNTDLTDKKRYDSIEIWDNGGDYFELKSDKSWSKAKGWNPEFINANLRVNKNMFDENSIVFAYPYSSSANVESNSTGNLYGDEGYAMPVFNVAQIWLDKNNAQFKKTETTSKKFHINYDFGKQIDDYYTTNGSNYVNTNLNNIYPYPSPGSFDEKNVNHSYNRLISVSPFDNTIVYAAKPNIREDIFGPYTAANRDKWAGFWLANSWSWDRNNKAKYYHPLVVANDASIISDADRYDASEMSYMLSNINDLYRDGFTFDISSRMDVIADGTTSLNLYFNQTGSGVNESYNDTDGLQSSKIGLLRNVLYEGGSNQSGETGSKGWGDSITPKFPGLWENWVKKLFSTTINKDSFSSIIHSRADLKKWYPRTWSNANFASNMLRIDELFWIDRQQLSDVPVATQFGSRLTGSAFTGGNKSIDLVSAWKDDNENEVKYNARFNRLIMQRPTIRAAQTAEENGLGLVTSYELPKTLFNLIVGKEDWGITTNQANLTLTKVDTVPNTSKQILSAWADSYKMKKITTTTGAIDQNSTAWNQEIPVTEVLDKKTDAATANSIVFGQGNNNNITRNGVPALRLMLRLVKPTGNLPSWFNTANFPDNKFFNKSYPLEAAYSGETTFKEIVNDYANEKARLIDLSEANNAAVGLGNLKIDVYLELNPKFGNYTDKTDKIYSVPGGKAIIDKNNGNQLIIYKDQFSGSRTIYDQSQINYDNFNQGGFGTSTNSSWSDSKEIGDLKNIKVTTDYNQLPDTLVRKNNNSGGSLLTFDFKDGTNDLEITPSDLPWFENHFKNYNRLLGLFIKFEYQNANGEWNELTHTSRAGNNLWTDQEITTNLADNNNKLLLSNVPQDIKKLRFKLVKNPDQNDPNATIDITNFADTDAKYTSNEFGISVQRIMVDKNWIAQQTLTNGSQSLADLNATDITKFEQSVLNQITNESERNEVKLVYEFEGESNLDASALAQKIQAKFNNFADTNQGFFALWDGNGAGIKIKAKFALKNNTNDFKLVVNNNSNPQEVDLSNDVKSNIKSKIDIAEYINQLKSKPISATIGDQPGKITPGTVQVPAKSGTAGTGRFNGKSFSEIKTILATQGISIKFKQQDANGAWSADWIELENINTYATSDPKIKMGFIFDSTTKPANLQLLEGQTEITNNKEYELKLNLPKVIKLPDQTGIDSIINEFKNQNVFSGDTKNLEVNNLEAAKTKAVEILINASGGGSGFDPIKNNGLIFQFKLGSSEWKEANDLKTWLSQQTTDINDNSIKMKVVLSNTLNNDFMLDVQLQQKEFDILEDNNKKVKKYINGTDWENALKAGNGISLNGGSNKDNLTYTFNAALTEFSGNGQVSAKEVTLEYQLVTANNNGTWQQGNLPSQVDANVNGIKVRIANISTIDETNKIYTYGPQKENQQSVLTIDLQNIPTILNIDPAWFEQTPISDTPLNDLNLLTTSVIQTWEQKIWQKVNNGQGLPQELSDKVYIKYTLEIGNGGHENLEATTLQNVLLVEQRKYNSNQHHGIFRLWNSTDSTGYKIKATFAKRPGSEQKIQFKKDNQNIDNDENLRTSFVNTDNVKSTLDLSAWIKNLIDRLTVVSTDVAGTIPAGGLKPPTLDGAADSKLFAQQEFANIENWLRDAKVNFLWRKEETGNDWKTGTNAITQYDPTKKKLWFALDNQSNNLILKLGNGFSNLDSVNRDNKANPIEIKLDAPAIIDVHPNQISDIGKYFSGNTKQLNVNEAAITQKLTEIKKQLGAGFENAPLTIMIQVGNQPFYDYKEVAKELAKLTDDVANGIVVAKFAINQKDPNKDKFQIKPGGDANQQILNDDGTIKVYINDNGIYSDLQNTIAKGTSKKLDLEWQNGISIDPTSGVLTATNPTRGKGLKIEYTFNKTLTGTEANTGNNVNNDWVVQKPTTFTPGVDEKLFIRIRLMEPAKYVYDQINQKIEIDLTKIKSIITLDPAWLNQPIAQTEIDINNFDLPKVQEYEDKVLAATQIPQTLKDKIEIRYAFNGQQDLDKAKLIELIKGYKAANTTQDNLGILQLWNQTSGQKINAKFVVKESEQNLYELEITGGSDKNKHDLDTSNVFTTIEFDKVIKWLTETNKLVEVQGNAQSATFKIPSVNVPGDDTFNTKEWTEIEKVLSSFGITIQYREILDANAAPAESDWKNSLGQISKYDENIGKIGIRFKFNNQKSANIKLKTGPNTSDIYNGKTIDATPEFKLSLNVKLTLKITQSFVNDFVNGQNVISGNTKYLNIDNVQEQAMVKKIKDENQAVNSEFAKAGLIVKYKLETQSEWKEKDSFINDLQSTETDQQSNKVLFKFEVTDTNNFAVDGSDQTLFDPQTQTDHDQWKVKFFINDSNWEANASKIVVTGITSGLNWKWTPLGVSESPDNKVGNEKLEVQFSAKSGVTYDDPDVEDNGDIKTKWTRTKPTQLDPTIQDLWIRLKAKAGYVYGPAYDQNGHQKTASVHKVDLQIKREIVVNPKALSTSLSLPAGKQYVTDITKADLEKFVNDGVGAIPTLELQQYVTVKFNFNKRNGLTSEQLYNEIQSIITTNAAPNYGILQLWNGTLGEKIEAYYELKDPKGEYVLITANNGGNPSEPQEIIVDHIATRINLKEIVSDLKNQKIQVESNTSKKNRTLVSIQSWIMPKIKAGTAALNGLDWDTFEQRLNQVGVSIEARIVNNPDNNTNDWKPLKDLKQYDDTTLQLALRFKIDQQKAANIVLSVLQDDDVNVDGNVLTSGEFKMNIKAPATVVVKPNYLTEFKTNYQISGDTKYITMDDASETQLIQKIADENVAANPTVFQDLKDRLFIEYYLGKTASTDDNDWRTAKEFKEFLEGQSNDQETNRIWFRLNVKDPEQEDGQVFQIDKSAKELIPEQIDAQAKVKIYINETGFTEGIKNLRAVGSTDDFSITGLDDWKQTLPKKGLEVGYSNETDPKEEEDTKWTPQPPTTLNTDKKLWVRFKVTDGYKFEGAKQNDAKYGPKQAINTDGIKVIIKLQKQWLEEKIKITGNTKEAVITETEVLQTIKDAGVLPTGQDDLVELQYKIKSTNDEWITKDEFIEKLKKLAGSKDSNNFILRREELLVKFSIKNKNTAGDYGLNIDNQNIDDSNRDNYNVQIVDDASNRNETFEGYINLDKLTNFIKDNFHIVGSTSQPRLIINNREQMDTMFAPYASETLFDILFSTTKDQNNNWQWDQNKSILTGGKLIDENGLITQGVTIGADKKFAIKFVSKNQKYKVYKGEQEQTDGYVLYLSDNVKITIEITNPFTAAGKTLGIWTRDGSNGKYFQGEGGFKIVIADQKTLDVDQTNIQSAQEFLNQANSIQQNEKDALELVFHYFGQSPSDSEIQRVKAAINDYNDSNTWKSFDEIKDSNNGDWSTNQGYKVGDYLAVALRVKKQYATAEENAFVLKGDDYSMILPVMQDATQKEKKPGRIAGYKIKTSDVTLDNESVTLLSMVNPDLPPLDGWTLLSRLSLNPDDKGNYLGVDLDLQFYNEFYKNGSDEILISGSGAKLVKRETSGDGIETDGEYKDGAGKPIKDKDGNVVKIYKNKKTNRLSNPEKKETPTKTKRLDNSGQGSFRLIESNQKEQGLLSLFKNQDVDLKLVASQGEGTTALPDFYLDEQKNIELKNIINPKIKYPIENENQISYGWNYENFLADKIQYKDPNDESNKRPEEGFAQIATILELVKKQKNQDDKTITGKTTTEAIQKIQEELDKDFKNQLKFQIERHDNKGNITTYTGNNIYQFTDLKNKDRIVLKIVATEDDLYYVNTERPLIINVDGLTQASPDKSTLQHLRVKQGGVIDGQGSFKVLVSNPNNANEDDRQILKGWKFMIRVWGTDKKIKIQWTDDPGLVKGLTNGDRVEWKLVSEEGNPVTEAYYNTIALQHQQNSDGTIDYKFAQVNYKNGDGTYDVVKEGIGDYPDDETKYPEDSGFVISGLKSAVDIFQISKDNFAKVMQQLNPTYVGINKQGTIKMEPKYFEDKYWVNSDGELFTKDQQATLKDQDQELTKKEIPLTEFLDNVTFYTHDPVLANYQGGFKFSGNDVNNNNHLTNGDKVWATFDMLNESDENIIINGNEIVSSVTLQLADVSGLKEVIDPMSPLWYVLMALAGVVTLGTAALIAFLMTRHKKLKGK